MIISVFEGDIAKKWPQRKKKKVFFYQDNTPCHKSIVTMAKLHELHSQLLPNSPYSPDLAPPQRLLAVCRPQKNAPEKEIWLQWRSDIRNWGVFWGQSQIIQQKRHQIVRETLESVYHPRRRLLMNKVEFCLKVMVLLVRPGTYWVMCYQ